MYVYMYICMYYVCRYILCLDLWMCHMYVNTYIQLQIRHNVDGYLANCPTLSLTPTCNTCMFTPTYNTYMLTPSYTYVQRVTYRSYLLRKIRRYIDVRAGLLIYKGRILLYIDYGDFLYHSASSKKIHETQTIQNQNLKLCLNLPPRNNNFANPPTSES